MATVKLILRTHQADKTGAAPLYIRVIKDRKTKFISTGYKFLPAQWNPIDQVVRKSFKGSARMNALLAQKVADASGEVADLERNSKTVSARRLKEAIKHGFKYIIVPRGNAPQKPIPGVEIIAVARLHEALQKAFEIADEN